MDKLKEIEIQICTSPKDLKMSDLVWLVDRCKYQNQQINDLLLIVEAQAKRLNVEPKAPHNPRFDFPIDYPNGDNA